MFRWFDRRRHQRRTAHDFYGSIVAAARRPALFAEYGVPDTVEGRLELLIAHIFVVLERLSVGGEEEQGIAQALVDGFFADMDVSARELGTGDMAVPKKMRQLASVARSRWEGYRAAARNRDEARLMTILQDAIPGEEAFPARDALARYMLSMLDELAKMPIDSLQDGISTASQRALRTARPVGH